MQKPTNHDAKEKKTKNKPEKEKYNSNEKKMDDKLDIAYRIGRKRRKKKGGGYLYLGFLLHPHNFCLLFLSFFFPSTTLLCIATVPASSFAKYPFIACYAERGIGLISIGFICVP